MRRRAGTSDTPAHLSCFDEDQWAGADYGERLTAWLAAWDAFQAGTGRAADTRNMAEQDAWSAYPDEPWDPSDL